VYVVVVVNKDQYFRNYRQFMKQRYRYVYKLIVRNQRIIQRLYSSEWYKYAMGSQVLHMYVYPYSRLPWGVYSWVSNSNAG